VKKFVDDPSLPWEERFNRLLDHHEKETTYLINYNRTLTNQVVECDEEIERVFTILAEIKNNFYDTPEHLPPAVGVCYANCESVTIN